jgi:SAM-dependent methyltransferase
MRTKTTSTLALVVLATVAILAQAPGVHPISGRRFAGVMSYEGAAWLDREERDIEEEPDRALDAIRIEKGSTVADVGAGSGYMTVRMARRVGPEGRVYATDIQPQMLAMLRERLQKERLSNVTPVQGAIDDPRLPPETLDLILLVDVYHEFSQPQQMLRGLRGSAEAGRPAGAPQYRRRTRQSRFASSTR